MYKVTTEFELAAEDIAGQILAATDRSKKTATKPEVRWNIDKHHESRKAEIDINCWLDKEF